MSRLLGAALLASAQGTASPVVSFFCVNSCRDGGKQSYCVNNSTEYQGCGTPPAGCDLMAYQTLYNEGTCEAFKASQPICFGPGHGVDSWRCPDAAVFQLVMGRNRDLDRTYAAHDFAGVAGGLYRRGAVFADSAFEANIADLYTNWSSSQVSVNRVPRHVLGRNAGPNSSTWVLHEVGSWVEGGDVDRYTRWSYSGSPLSWQIETDIDLRETESKSEPSYYKQLITERYAVYSALYESGNISDLVADLYTSDAVLALSRNGTSQHFKENGDHDDNLIASLSLLFDSDPHRAFSVSVAFGEENANVVHDIGTISMSSDRYYARWEKCDGEWKIAAHVQRLPHGGQPRDNNLEEGKPDVLVA